MVEFVMFGGIAMGILASRISWTNYLRNFNQPVKDLTSELVLILRPLDVFHVLVGEEIGSLRGQRISDVVGSPMNRGGGLPSRCRGNQCAKESILHEECHAPLAVFAVWLARWLAKGAHWKDLLTL